MPLSAAERLGRRWVHCGCMVLATVPILACVPLVSSHQAAVTALSITFKLVSNVGWFIMWVQAMEVTPPPSPVSCADCVPADHPHPPAQLGLHHLLHRGQVCRDDGTIRRGFGIYGHNI